MKWYSEPQIQRLCCTGRGRERELGANLILCASSLHGRRSWSSFCSLCLRCVFLEGCLFALGKIKGAVNVFNDNHRSVGGLDEQFSELRIGGNFCEFNIIDIILQVISNGCYHAGLASPWRSIQQVASFPCFSCSVIKLLSLGEVQEVRFDLSLQLRAHR